MSGGGRGGCLSLLLDLPLEEAAALGLVHDLHVVVDGHVGPVGRVAVVLGTAFRWEERKLTLRKPSNTISRISSGLISDIILKITALDSS